MKIIGITGRIGSGKTTLAKDLSHYMNIPVFNCDNEVKLLYLRGDIKFILESEFGSSIFNNGSIDYTSLSNIIFKDQDKLKFVQKLIRPFLLIEYGKFIKKCLDLNLFVCAIESAILFGSDFENKCNLILVKTTSDDNINIKRCCENRNMFDHEVKLRLSKQMTEKEMLSYDKTFEVHDYKNFYEEYKYKIDELI